MPSQKSFLIHTLSVLIAGLTLQGNLLFAQEPDMDKKDREPANQHSVRRRPVRTNAQPVYTPQYIPQKRHPRVGLVISGLLGYDMLSSGNQSASNPGFGITVGYAFTSSLDRRSECRFN